jgi:hypothetical protein
MFVNSFGILKLLQLISNTRYESKISSVEYSCLLWWNAVSVISFQCFRVAWHWKFEALCFSKTSVTVSLMIWCNIPENLILYQHHCENIKSGIIFSNPIETNMCYTVKYYNSLTLETEICCLHRRKLNMDLHKSLFLVIVINLLCCQQE